MTISFDDLIALVADKSHYARICAAADRYERARQTLADAESLLERVEREIEDLCDSHSDSDDSDFDDETEDTGEGEQAPKPRAQRPKAPRVKPPMPGPDASDPRSPEEYVNALDEVGHELATTGAVPVRSSAVLAAMKNRSFPDRARVMAFLKGHPSWHALPEGHSMFRYAFAPRIAVVEESAASEG